MARYIVKRILLFIPTLLGITLITFILMQALPGDPVQGMAGDRANPETIARIRAELGQDRPLPLQYIGYLKLISTGELGRSNYTNRKIADDLIEKFPNTLRLALAAILFASTGGIALGVYAAVKRGAWQDRIVTLISVGGISVPIFWLALMLKIVFYDKVDWIDGNPLLPVTGRYDTTLNMYCLEGCVVTPVTNLYTVDAILAGNGVALIDAIKHLALPAITLSYVTMALITRMMRSSMLEVLNQEYIKTARSKGLSEKVVVRKHARRNALIPTTTVIGLAFGGLLGGAVLTETVFDWPGLGQWSATAIVRLDSAAVMGFTLLSAVIYVLANLVVDLLYAYLDPRIRLGE